MLTSALVHEEITKGYKWYEMICLHCLGWNEETWQGFN